MITLFENLLAELGKILGTQLHVDHSNSCSIRLHDTLTLQLQPDLSQENLWIFCKLIEVPPGSFRTMVLTKALQANGLQDPRIGSFGWIDNSSELAFFQKYPLRLLNGEKLSGFIGAFVEMSERWHKAIESGDLTELTK